MYIAHKYQLLGLLSAAAIAAVAGSTILAAATVVNVQFDVPHQGVSQVYTGTAAAPETGTFWNQINTSNTNNSGTVSGANLTASDGVTATTIGFTITGSDLYGSAPNFAFNNNGTNNNLLKNFVVGGPFAKCDKKAEILTISGLIPGHKYDIYFYGSKNAGADSTLTIGKTTVVTDGRPVRIPSRWHVSKTGEFVAAKGLSTTKVNFFDRADKGHTWNVILGIVANNKGEIIGNIGTGSDAGYAAVNGFQVVSSSHK